MEDASRAEFLARVNAADVDEFSQIVLRAGAEEQEVLADHLGEDRFQELHELALRGAGRRGAGHAGNVVVLHGIMGGELTTTDRAGALARLWVHAPSIILGNLGRLRLAADGRRPFDPRFDVHASGILKRHYGKLLLTLAADWDVRAFWFDWRMDLDSAAAALDTKIDAWFGDEPVHLVAHSMGGLVARTFTRNYRRRWDEMRDGDLRRGGRLVMLGTPNHGSFAIPQVITGLEKIVRKLALLDIRNSRSELLRVLNSFAGTYQMLPSPFKDVALEPLYDARTWGALDVPQSHLDLARRHHELLLSAVEPERMVYVAGTNQPTLSGLDPRSPASERSYAETLEGDGRVTHAFGRLEGVDTYYVDCSHGDLTADADVLAALDDLLPTGRTDRLTTDAGSLTQRLRTADGGAPTVAAQTEAEVERLQQLLGGDTVRLRARESRRVGAAQSRAIEEEVVSGLLATAAAPSPGEPPAPQGEPLKLAVRLVWGGIQDVHAHEDVEPVDVISVGHYTDVLPQDAEAALDASISAVDADATPAEELPSERLLAGFTLRGILRGRLGEPFFLPDPRPERQDGGRPRLVAVAGMGEPGRFGAPELTVLARELCWTLGRMERRHLATVLIGAGNGNLTPEEAVGAWISGIRAALAGSKGAQLEQVTFAEADPRKVPRIHRAILRAVGDQRRHARLPLEIDYRGPERQEAIKEATRERDAKELERAWEPGAGERADDVSLRAPTRITLSLEGGTYRFGAITDRASVPEREVPLDPALVATANAELAAEGDVRRQRLRGDFLARLLFPHEFLAELRKDSPVVLLLDAASAEIHWELMSQPDDALGAAAPSSAADALGDFLGIRGLTRQLRTTFAPPPEPPPPPRRVLRVLVVADPAADMPLPGAEDEGMAVVDAFERFNAVYGSEDNRVEVTALLGPRNATRTNVMRTLMQTRFDVLHFAGHCVFEPGAPMRSGWIFTGGQRLAANELSRLDRVPKFVFSNACESGIAVDDSRAASSDLAPSFAGTFFNRGVGNFVCTAWPINDAAALEFALVLYASLLGLPVRAGDEPPGRAAPIFEAMRDARRAIAVKSYGAKTWGAYQHYGNPHFRFFERLPTARTAGTAAQDVPAKAAYAKG